MRHVLLALGCCATLAGGDADTVVTWVPGCLAKIYVCGTAEIRDGKEVKAGPAWPIKALPDSPAEVLLLTSVPTVEPPSAVELFTKSAPTNVLLSKSKTIPGVNFYAVEFEGYLLAPIEGVYAVAAASDDPLEIYVEGKLIAKGDSSADPNQGRMFSSDRTDAVSIDQVKGVDPPTIAMHAVQGSVKLAPNRYYHVSVVNRQQWFPASKYFNGTYNTYLSRDMNRGACFKAWMTTPDNKTAPLQLHLPQAK